MDASAEKKDYEPPIHIRREGDKWGICLSRLGKIVASVATFLIGSVLLGALAFAWNSNRTLGEIGRDVAAIDSRVNRIDNRIDRIDDKLDRKADR